MYILFLILFAVITIYTAFQGNREYKIFKKLTTTDKRQAFYKKWLVESWLLFGLAAIISLILIGEPDKIIHPLVHEGFSAAVPEYVKTDSEALQGFYTGVIFGLAIAVILTVRRAKSAIHKKLKTVGDIESLIPRNKAERILGIHTAIAAGINEELFFRAALPVILFGVLGNVSVAIAISLLVFGLGHIYQGWKGVLGTLIVGWLLMKVFILTGNILVPIALHIAIDLWGLVLLPYIAEKAKKS